MPGRRRASFRGMRPVINSIKNNVSGQAGLTTTPLVITIAKAVDAPASASNPEDVSQGCIIKAVYINFDVCGLAGTTVLQRTGIYIWKNPGNNLTEPGVFVTGTSNEKKFIFKQWQFMTMLNADGNPPNHVEGWLKIPKRYQRMGTDDRLEMIMANSSATGHETHMLIYKWYR